MEKRRVKVEKAQEMGFCFGVRQALKIVEEAASQYGRIQTLGAIVHNPQVVAMLAARGVMVAENLQELKGKFVAIPSHGVGEQVLEEIKSRGLQVVDATCPFVRKAQRTAKELAKAGFLVVVFGDASHPEVRGVLGWMKGMGIAALGEPDVLNLNPRPARLGILSQTTQSPSQFARFVSRVADSLTPELKELRVVNTICDATKKRQEAALELARRVAMMIVVGGKNSANSRRLAEICTAAGVETHHIETAEELQESWLKGQHHIGITAGASTPDEAIEEVIQKLKRLESNF